MPAKTFTAAETAEIQKMLDQKKSTAEIAHRFGRSEHGIRVKLAQMRAIEVQREMPQFPRKCLGPCGQVFLSPEPVATRRICDKCRAQQHAIA